MVAPLISTRTRVVLGVAMKPDVPKADFSDRNSAAPHSPVSVMTVASFSDEGMFDASTVYSVDGSGFRSSRCSLLQYSSAAKSSYWAWSSFSVTPESSTPSSISAQNSGTPVAVQRVQSSNVNDVQPENTLDDGTKPSGKITVVRAEQSSKAEVHAPEVTAAVLPLRSASCRAAQP